MRPTHRRRRSGRVRALLSLGLLLGITQVSTLASWTDSATVQGGGFSSGTLDLKVGESAADQLPGQGGSWTHSTMTLGAMAPGESVARALTVGNGGSVALTYNATVVTSNNDLFNTGTPGLQVTVVEGATASNGGAQASNSRAGTCTGGTATSLTTTNVSTTASGLHGSAAALASGATRTYCVLAKLATTAPNSMQGKTTSLTFSFNAQQ
ncbi:MAG TPA: SipW-dependent-type signal peptide-containing protein [Nocardioides sp.]|nr:SipW-dependent-type signal peptide-containing protein [Nocardioides sp.]